MTDTFWLAFAGIILVAYHFSVVWPLKDKVARLGEEADWLLHVNKKQRSTIDSLAARCYDQSELLSRSAEKRA